MAQTARGSLCFRHGLKTVNFYDAQPRPAMAGFNRTLYSCVHNLQGDVVGIVDSAGSVVVEYRYDTVSCIHGKLAYMLGEYYEHFLIISD